MRYVLAIATGLACLTQLVACGSDPDPQERDRQPMAVEDTVFGDMIQTEDRARAVEDLGFEHKKDMDRTIDEESGQ
jgi:hypothetical protein